MPENKPKIIKNISLWIDLLGFGSPLADCKWDLSHPNALQSFERLKRLNSQFQQSASPAYEVALMLNDGLCRSIDIYEEQNDFTYLLQWLNWTLLNYYTLNSIDRQSGHPGLRGVLSFGNRFAYMPEGRNASESLYCGTEAYEQLKNRKYFYAPYQFQMNTAFSKSYIIESIGGKGGISGPSLYVDKFFIESIISIYSQSRLTRNSFIEVRTENSLSLLDNIVPDKYSWDWQQLGDNHWNFRLARISESTQHDVINMHFDKEIAISTKGIDTMVYRLSHYIAMDDSTEIRMNEIFGEPDFKIK